MRYRVNEIYASIQGEGAKTGVPMIVLRLQGCLVGCPWCDTKLTWDKDGSAQQSNQALAVLGDMECDDLVSEVCQTGLGLVNWVMLTGGEPAEQELAPLVHALQEAGYRIALETSGTALGHLGAGIDWVCVSPKWNIAGSNGLPVLERAVAGADEYKFVVGRQSDIAKWEHFLVKFRANPKAVISLQPLSESKRATQICVAAAHEKGWRVSIQVHKVIGLP